MARKCDFIAGHQMSSWNFRSSVRQSFNEHNARYTMPLDQETVRTPETESMNFVQRR